MAFGEGHKVTVRAPDGSGIVLRNVRVDRVEPDGSQAVSCDAVEWWDVETMAEAVEEAARR